MKRNLLFILILAFALTACGSNSNATPLPTVVLENNNAPQATSSPRTSNSGGVAASGYVMPAQQAKVSFTLPGNIKSIYFAENDVVKAGDVLAELDNTMIQIEVEQARRTLRELTSPSAIAAAEQAVANAQKTLEDSQKKADSLLRPRASDTVIDNTQGEIDLAKEALARAADSYRQVARLPDGDPKKAAALVAMTNAQLYLNSLLAKYNWITGTATDTDAALIQANLDTAKAALQEAKWYLSALKGEQLPPEATGTRLSQLEQARDALKIAQEKLDNTRLVAPIAGTVIKVNSVAGEYVVPGQVVFLISDVANLHVETTDLSERDVPKVQVGQTVTVLVDALNTEITGRVTAISPLADTLGGDVVYKTTISLDSPPAELRAGMSVEVRYGQ